MTSGCARISAGGPSAITRPWFRTITVSEIPITRRMSCSTTSTVTSPPRILRISATRRSFSAPVMPAAGMRLWSEERRLGTIELLLTMPVAAWQAIVGKFLASWLFLIVALALTFPMIFTVNWLGDPDNGVIVSGYVGAALLAGAYLAISCMTSALTRNQVIAFILAVVICLLLILVGFSPLTDLLARWASPWVVESVAKFSVLTYYDGFQKGVVDSRGLLYFFSIMAYSLFVTGVVIRNHRTG